MVVYYKFVFSSKLKLFSMHYKFYDSFIIIFSLFKRFSSLLLGLQVLPLIGCLIIFTTPAWKVNQIRNYAFIVSLLTFTQLSFMVLFDPTSADWQFRYDLKCLFNQPYATDLMPDTSLGIYFILALFWY
jgi:hypothetical protein